MSRRRAAEARGARPAADSDILSRVIAASPPFPEPPEGIDRDGELHAGSLGAALWLTDIGKVRKRNEDRVLARVAFDGRYPLLVVTDGAGGHDSGDRAAMRVAAVFGDGFPEVGDPPPGRPADWLRATIARAHAGALALGSGQARPPAATVVGLLIERKSAALWRFHSGDSRLYHRAPGGELECWTRDHNIGNGLIDRGLPPEQAMRIAESGRLTQILGGTEEPRPDIWGPMAAEPGHSFLLCSDGVYGYNEDRDPLTPALDSTRPLAERRAALRDAILQGPCHDNFTALLWDVPADLVASEPVATVPQQVRGPDDAARRDMERYGVMSVDDEADEGDGSEPPQSSRGAETMDIAPVPSSREAETAALDPLVRPEPPADLPLGGALAVLVLVGVAILGVAAYGLRVDAEVAEHPPPTPHEATPESMPWPSDPDHRLRAELLVQGLDAGWWNSLPAAERARRIELLNPLVGLTLLDPMTLAWPEGEGEAEASFLDWPASSGASGANREALVQAWDARERVIAEFPRLAEQPDVRALLEEAACTQIEARWAEGMFGEWTLTDGGRLPAELPLGRLAEWSRACFTAEGPQRPVVVRLGDWPVAGWSVPELQALSALSKSPGGVLALPDLAEQNDRVRQLVQILQMGRAADSWPVDIELRLFVPPSDFPEGYDPVEALASIESLAARIASLLSDASKGQALIRTVAKVQADLVQPADPQVITADQRARLADLNRRIELVMTPRPAMGAPPSADPPRPPASPSGAGGPGASAATP